MKSFAIAAAAALCLGSAVDAATFTINGGTPYWLPSDYGVYPGTPEVVAHTWTTVNGVLTLDGPGRVTFTFLGSEAGYRNLFSVGETPGFDDKAVANPAFALTLGGGVVPFSFTSVDPAAHVANGAAFGYYDTIALHQTSPTTVFALFNDSWVHDKDFDDMVVRMDVAPVPLPAAAWLLLGGLGGLGALARRRGAAKA